MSRLAREIDSAQDRRMLWRICSISLVGAGAVLLLVVRAEPLLIHNASPSAPIGLYLRADRAPELGAFVTVHAVDVAAHYARARDFADASDRFIKRVAAVGGQTVCAQGDRITIGSALELTRASRDGAGRLLPSWSGCRTLGDDEVFLLGDTSDSFDSRYWGPVSIAIIDGVWTPLHGINLLAARAPDCKRHASQSDAE